VADHEIDLNAPATLRKWPSLNKERIPKGWGAVPYLVVDGTLGDCISAFVSKGASQHHLYEIHTKPQPPLVTEVLQAAHIVELARLREFLWVAPADPD
jgi:hypothetical protein